MIYKTSRRNYMLLFLINLFISLKCVPVIANNITGFLPFRSDQAPTNKYVIAGIILVMVACVIIIRLAYGCTNFSKPSVALWASLEPNFSQSILLYPNQAQHVLKIMKFISTGATIFNHLLLARQQFQKKQSYRIRRNRKTLRKSELPYFALTISNSPQPLYLNNNKFLQLND